MVNIKLIKEAQKNLSGLVEKTPVIRSYALSNLRNNNTYLRISINGYNDWNDVDRLFDCLINEKNNDYK